MSRSSNPARLIPLSVLAGLLVAACSPTDPLGPVVELSLVVQQPSVLPSTLNVEIGSSRTALHATSPLVSASTRLHVRAYGEQQVQITLVGNQADTLASVSLSQSLRSDYDYGIGVVVGQARPLGICVGPITATALRSSPGDTLFVASVGIPKGAIC